MGLCASSSPPAVPSVSDSGSVRDCLGDGKLLADYTVFLQEQGDEKAIKNLAKLELYRTDEAMTHKAFRKLYKSWKAYRKSDTGLGNFYDNSEWLPHDLPHQDVVKRISKKDVLVTEEDEQYSFAVAAMVGIHVATVCSSIVDRARSSIENDFDEDLYAESSRRFKIPVSGSAYSPRLIINESFEIEEFAPKLFSDLRALGGISDVEYCSSICRTDFQFIKFGTNSKSGELFFFSHDEKYLLKTTTDFEAEHLLTMLVDFKDRFEDEPRSMLGRYFGLYRLTMATGKSQLFFILGAIPSTPDKIHKRYDMKGSTRHRRAKPDDSVGKDINFWEDQKELDIAPDVAKDLIEIHEADTELLHRHDIMDYSLLIFIHDREALAANRESVAHVTISPAAAEGAESEQNAWLEQALSRSRSVESESSVRGRSRELTTREAITNDPCAGIPAANGRYVYYFGLIDILVPYRWYPKAQYYGMHIQTCGKGHLSSRVPPDHYYQRQLDMFARAVGVRDGEHRLDDVVASESSSN